MRGQYMQDDISNAAQDIILQGNISTLKKIDLIRSVQIKTNLSKTDSSQIINQMFSLITDSLASGKNVKLSNFGTFQLMDKPERIGRNPKTNEEVSIAPRRVVSFKASSKLTQRVIDANANTEDPIPQLLTSQKRDVLKALGNKIGSEGNDLDFIFKSASQSQIQQDVQIPDVRNINAQKSYGF